MEDINRIKMVLFEKKKTARWLAGEMGVTPSTVSKWCTNSSHLSSTSAQLTEITKFSDVDIRTLICTNKQLNQKEPYYYGWIQEY